MAGSPPSAGSPELSGALGHIARRRGFWSNSKHDYWANVDNETSKMLKAIAATRDRLGEDQTVGLMFDRYPGYQDRKTNRGQNFDLSMLRAALADETRLLSAA